MKSEYSKETRNRRDCRTPRHAALIWDHDFARIGKMPSGICGRGRMVLPA